MLRIFLWVFLPLAIVWLIFFRRKSHSINGKTRSFNPSLTDHPLVQRINLQTAIAEAELRLEEAQSDRESLKHKNQLNRKRTEVQLETLEVEKIKEELAQAYLVQNRQILEQVFNERLALEKARLKAAVPPKRVKVLKEVEVQQVLIEAPRNSLPQGIEPPKWVHSFLEEITIDDAGLDAIRSYRLLNPNLDPRLKAKLDMAERRIEEAMDSKIIEGEIKILKRKL